jgi:hypothetical protein
MGLLYKDKETQDQYKAAIAKKLPITMVVDYFVELSLELGINPVMTSFIRDDEDQIKLYGFAKPSLHQYLRAADFRSSIYTDEQIKYLVDKINARFEYDPSRPGKFKCALAHKIPGGAYHFHLQVHPSTVVQTTNE